MEVISCAKHIRQSPRKVRVVADVVRHLGVEEALDKLALSVRKAAVPVRKVLHSAVANAENNFGLKRESLKIKEIQVSPAPTVRRVRFRARGRADVIRKRNCHIRVVLEGEKEIKGKGKKPAERK